MPDEYLYYGEERNYNYGPGSGMLAGATMNVSDKLLLAVHYRGGWFSTINGNRSSFFLNTITSALRYFITKTISIGTE